MTWNVTYSDNVLTDGECPDFVMGNETRISYSAVDWLWSGSYIAWDSIGAVDETGDTYAVVKCDNTYYLVVSFALLDDEDNVYGNYFNPPVVKYAEADSTLSSYATVYWNSGIDRWNAEMDLTNMSSPIDWQCTMTVCDSTAIGAVIEDITYTLKGAGPCTIQEFMGGGGGSEEEEEEEEEEQ